MPTSVRKTRSRLFPVRDQPSDAGRSRGRLRAALAKTAYWAAVLAVSLALLVGLILLLESRDDSSVSGALIPALRA